MLLGGNMRFKRLLWVLILVGCILIPKVSVYAEEKEMDLINVESPKDLTIKISYEKNDATWSLITPSGAVINKDTDTDNITVYEGENATYVFIGTPEVGQWKIRYDKGSNEKLKVSTNYKSDDIWITAFSKGELNENELKASFKVSGNEGRSYDYKLMLTTDEQSITGKEIASGSAKANEDVNVACDMKNVSSYEGYYLLLYVNYYDDKTEIFDFARSEAFNFTNPNEKELSEDVKFNVNYDSYIVTANFEDATRGYPRVYVETYIDDELQSAESYEGSNKTARIMFTDDTKKVLVHLVAFDNNGLATKPYDQEFTIKGGDGFSLELPKDGLIDSNIYNFDYKNADETKVTFEINGKKEKVTLDGDGSSFIELDKKNNTIAITYEIDGNTYNYNRTANISTIEPSIELFKVIDGVKTSKDKIIVAGRADADTLTINGKEVELKDGEFYYTCQLKKGKNEIKIVSKIGEKSAVYEGIVTCEKNFVGFDSGSVRLDIIIPLCIGLLVSLVGIILMRRSFNNKGKEKVKTSKKEKMPKKHNPIVAVIISCAMAVGCWVLFIVRSVYGHSVKFIDLALESLDKANTYLKVTNLILILAIVLTVLAGLLTTRFVLKKKKKKNVDTNVDNNNKV